MNRAFKGVWIPKDIWLSRDLSWTEKLLLTEIDSLDNGDDHCYATNGYFQEFLQVSIPTITRSIKELESKEYISVEFRKSSTGTQRIIKRLIPTNQIDDPPTNQIDEHNNTIRLNNTISSKADIKQQSCPTCDLELLVRWKPVIELLRRKWNMKVPDYEIGLFAQSDKVHCTKSLKSILKYLDWISQGVFLSRISYDGDMKWLPMQVVDVVRFVESAMDKLEQFEDVRNWPESKDWFNNVTASDFFFNIHTGKSMLVWLMEHDIHRLDGLSQLELAKEYDVPGDLVYSVESLVGESSPAVVIAIGSRVDMLKPICSSEYIQKVENGGVFGDPLLVLNQYVRWLQGWAGVTLSTFKSTKVWHAFTQYVWDEFAVDLTLTREESKVTEPLPVMEVRTYCYDMIGSDDKGFAKSAERRSPGTGAVSALSRWEIIKSNWIASRGDVEWVALVGSAVVGSGGVIDDEKAVGIMLS